MNKPHVIAFYLPQYHPVKENNEWFGEGFTEWTNVGKARPLFKGHQQPRVPADLGYYDLRVPEVRNKQAELAKEAGISAFCYYHYWFGNDRKILEKPLEWVVECGEPNFPFCVCWANHSWYKKFWNPDVKSIEEKLLIEQQYPGDEDIINHFYYLKPIFEDPRYYKIDNRLVFSIYDCRTFPDFPHFKELWNKLARENNLPEFYFIGYTARVNEADSNLFDEFEGVILSLITKSVHYGVSPSIFIRAINKAKFILSNWFGYPLFVYDYKNVYHRLVNPIMKKNNIIPEVVPNWDYTPRRGAYGLILKNSTPELFFKHVSEALTLIKDKPADKKIMFVKSWNEWGEGNYLEPDLKYGREYIKALRRAIDETK